MSRTLGALLCLLLLALAAPVTLDAATHNGPGVSRNGARALPASDLGPNIDPDG